MTDIRLIEYEPGKWRVDRRETPVARSSLPMPHVISDEMPATEQVDGNFYTSKSAFRRVGRRLGLTEVGNEKPSKPKWRSTSRAEVKKARQDALHRAAARYRNGERVNAE